MNVPALLEAVISWAERTRSVDAVALVGSYARGTARVDSDVDLVILSDSPEHLFDGEWLAEFGVTESWLREDYGMVQSIRVVYVYGLEVEFGISRPSWANVPLDPGTRSVVASGCRILYDPKGMLQEVEKEAGI